MHHQLKTHLQAHPGNRPQSPSSPHLQQLHTTTTTQKLPPSKHLAPKDSIDHQPHHDEVVVPAPVRPVVPADDDRHKYYHQPHLHSNYPLTPSLSVFPSSSLRDILALIFVLLSLPLSVSLGLLLLYIFLGSNFMGGKFIILSCLMRENPNFINYRGVLVSFFKIFLVNSGVFYVLNLFIHKKDYFNYIIILSKTIISSDLLGSSSINHINTISNKKMTTKIQYDENRKFLNRNLLNSAVCFVIIYYITYLMNRINLSFSLFDGYNPLEYITNYNFSPIKKIYLILSIHIINSSVFKKSTIIHNIIPNTFDDISINCDSNKPLDVDLKDRSSFQKSTKHILKTKSVAIKNFENFIILPFNSKLTILKNKLKINTNENSTPSNVPVLPPTSATTTSTTTTSTSTFTSTSLTTTTVSPHITTIENTIIIQPFWSIVAACKAILRNPNLFNGESTRCKNNGGKFISRNEINHNVKMTTMLIDDSKIVFGFLDNVHHLNLNNLKIKLNNVNWNYFKVIDDYLVIYGLTSLFQYEVDIIYAEGTSERILNHFVINTTNDDDLVLNKSLPETSSLKTLQISLISTMKNLNSLKAKYKKLKKEENKKLSEIKNSIDNLKSKISKYTSKQNNDNRVFGKLKGLKHSVIQLENEIEQLNNSIEQVTHDEDERRKQFETDELELLNEITQQEQVLKDYESRIAQVKLKLKDAKAEYQSMSMKHAKLMNKELGRAEEIKTLQNDLKNIKKNEIANKFTKKIKKTNEKFETILPKVTQETEILLEECSRVLNE